MQAQQDPEAARSLYRILTYGEVTPMAQEKVRALFVRENIPLEFIFPTVTENAYRKSAPLINYDELCYVKRRFIQKNTSVHQVKISLTVFSVFASLPSGGMRRHSSRVGGCEKRPHKYPPVF